MIRSLEWDSDFFQLKVGVSNVLNVKEVSESELEVFDLVYIFSNEKKYHLPENYFLADR
jgi:hypothetical protein